MTWDDYYDFQSDARKRSGSSQKDERHEEFKDSKRAPEKNTLGEMIGDDSDVKGNSDDAYTGRSVKSGEFLIQDIEVDIGKMRNKPNDPSSGK